MANQTAINASMAVNTYGSATYASAVKREIVRRMEQEAQYSSYFEKFTGEIDKFNRVPNSVVVRKSELREGGDSMIIPMKTNISITPVYGDTTLLGTEASQELYKLEVKVNQWRASVAGPKGNQNFRIKYLNMLQQMKPDLVRAISREQDADHFRALNEGYSLNLTATTASDGLGMTKYYHHKIYGVGETYAIDNNAASLDVWARASSATTPGTIGSTDVLDLDAIDAIKAIGKTQKIATLNLEGGMWWVLLVHPNAIYNIQTANSNAWRAGVETAAERGKTNPFFTGAVWAYNGIILHEHPDVPSILGNGDGTITFGYKDNNTAEVKCSYLLGQNALGFAEGSDMQIIPETYDYKNVNSIGAAQINGIARFDFAKDDGNMSTFISQGSLMILSFADTPTL